MSKIYVDENENQWCLYFFCKEGGISLSPFCIYEEEENLKLIMIFDFQFTFVASMSDKFDFHIFAVRFDESFEKTNAKSRENVEKDIIEFSMMMFPKDGGIAYRKFDNFYVQFDTELMPNGLYSVSIPYIKMKKDFLNSLMKKISSN